MKAKLIMLDNPIVVSDERHGLNDFVYKNGKTEQRTIGGLTSDQFYWGSEKIIAGLPELPSINWNGLEKEFGWVDVDKLAKDIYPVYQDTRNNITNYDTNFQQRDYWIKGFKKAQELSDKKFSLEGIQKAIRYGLESHSIYFELNLSHRKIRTDGFIESLQQLKIFNIEIEMESYHEDYHGAETTDETKKCYGKTRVKIIKKL